MSVGKHFRAYECSTITGVAVIGAGLVGVLLQEINLKQGMVLLVFGILSILIRQVTGPTIVTGSSTTVTSEHTAVQPQAGAVTTIRQ